MQKQFQFSTQTITIQTNQSSIHEKECNAKIFKIIKNTNISKKNREHFCVFHKKNRENVKKSIENTNISKITQI